MKHFNAVVYLFATIFFLSCNAIDVFEKTDSLPKHEWSSKSPLKFTFSATDTLGYYNIYFVLRHTESYHFNNIWIDFTSISPKKDSQTHRLNVPLTTADGWLGSSMDDIIEQRILVVKNPVKLSKGNYIFSIQQVMREDPLQNILNAGVRVEKVVQ